jgi:putative ABC transport system substrate-binding protein
VSLKVDVLGAVAAPETAAARQATNTVPIVFVVHGDPVGSGDLATLARPGGNVTGLGQMAPEISTKQLQILQQVVPRVARVAVIWNIANPTKTGDWREVKASAQTLGIVLQSREVRRREDSADVFAAIRRDRPDALLTLVDPVTVAMRASIAEFAARERLPAMYPLQVFVEAGGLISYGADIDDLFRRAPRYVDRILKGASDLWVMSRLGAVSATL